MSRLREKIFGIGITLVILSIITIAVLSFRQSRKVDIVSSRIDYTRTVLIQINNLYNAIISHAGAARSYSITGIDKDVQKITTTGANLLEKFEELKTLVKERPSGQVQSDSLEKYIRKRIDFSNQLIAEGQQKGLAAANTLYQTGTGRDYNNLAFLFIQKMQADELNTLQQDETKNIIGIKRLNYYLSGLLIFILMLILILVQKARMDFANRKANEEKLTTFNQQLQQQVEEKTSQLTGVFERITDAFIALDTGFRYTYVNKKAGEIVNRDPATLIGKNIWAEFPDDVSQPFYQAALTAMQNQEYVHLEEYYPAYNRWFENDLYPSPEGLSIFFRDISERKTAEDSLRRSEERYRALIEQASDAIMITDNKGNFIDVNSSFCSQFGYIKEELMGLNISKVIDPDQLSKDPVRFDVLMAGQTIFRERRMMHKNGKVIEVEANVKMLPDGRMLAIARDITERKRAAEERERVSYLLNERVKELTTLYKAGQILEREDKTVEAILKEIVSIIPAGWQYPEICAARIVLGKDQFSTNGFSDSPFKQTAQFEFSEELSGTIDVVYLEERPAESEGPFLGEERNLINMLGEMLEGYFIRKKATELIVKEKNLSDSIINSLPGIFYLRSLVDGKLLRWNTNFQIVTGATNQALADSILYDFVAPEDRDIARRAVERAIQQGSGSVEAHLLTKEGSIPYFITGTPITYQKQPCLMGTGIDISSLKTVQEELRVSEQKYKLLFENNPLPIIMYSKKDLQVMDVNDSAVTHYGYSRDEFLQMNIKDLRPEEEVDRFLERVKDEIPSHGYLGTWRHKKKDGTIIDVEISGHEIIYEGVRVRLVLCNDVTEQLKAQENLKSSYEEIRLLASNIENIREQEKIKIAREIHDELGQQLTGLKMDVSWLSKKLGPEEKVLYQKTKEILALLDETVKSVRRIASELRPGLLDDLGLVAAMEWQSEEFEKRSGIKTHFSSSVNDANIPSNLATGFFRIYQESLTNVARHAQAHEIIATLEKKNDELILWIKDDGKGFDAKEIQNKKTLGLLGMKERTMMMGGRYEIASRPGRGTTVTVSVSLAKADMEEVDHNT